MNPFMKRTASARWQGPGKDGKGTLSTPSKVLDQTAYSYHTRFENGAGTNPEELIAAAHAGCFNMALSFMLGAAGLTPEQLDTTATLRMEQEGVHWTITEMHLEVSARIPGADPSAFQAVAEQAKANCPVSKVLNARITMNAQLSSAQEA
jgi:lipoyl-dependent peroxiredoxin